MYTGTGRTSGTPPPEVYATREHLTMMSDPMLNNGLSEKEFQVCKACSSSPCL